MTTKDMDLDCYGINLEMENNEGFERVLSLKSKIDTLQRYNLTLVTQLPKMNKSIEGDYIKYSDLVELLNR